MSDTGAPERAPRVCSFRWEALPTPGGGVRRLVRLDPADELALANVVAAATPSIRRCLGGESHASRVTAWHPSRGLALEPWRRARRRWLRDVRRLGRDARWVAVTDARACYPSIEAGVVVTRLRTLGIAEDLAAEIGSWLRSLQDRGVQGLPVGPAASSVLAEAVLAVGDDAVRSTGTAHVRWVDDVVIFAPDRLTGIRALDALRRSWQCVGLDLHEGKTAILTGHDACAGIPGAHATSSMPAATLR
jgi:hypothetical protein